MDRKGIDVSAYNPVSDYSAVAKSGVKIAILRITEIGNKLDPSFEKNYKGFRAQSIKVGVYKYSYALNTAQAKEEAEKVLAVLKKRKLEFPIFYDLEWSRQRALGSAAITRIAKAFRQVIVDGGYLFGIYCNTDWYYHVLDTKSLPYDYWLAAYPYNDRGVIVESLRPPVGIGWQYSSKGKVPGIPGNTDMNVFYKEFPTRPKDDSGNSGGNNNSGNGNNSGNSNNNSGNTTYLTYTIKPGDTLSAIALAHHTTVERLAELNHIADVNLIIAGDTLKIPKASSTYKPWVAECTGNGVYVRTGPGTEHPPLKEYPFLNKGNLVEVIGEKHAKDGVRWYHILIADKYRGYMIHTYLRKKK